MKAQQLLADYNNWRLRTSNYQEQQRKGHFMRSIKPTSKKGLVALEALEAMIAWCATRQLDPRRWLYVLFSMRRWLYAPRFDHLMPKDPSKGLARYHEGETPLWSQQMQGEAQIARTRQGKVFDRNRDLSATSEALKRRYVDAGDHERCMAEMESVTFGYHPRSLVCVRCAGRFACAKELQVLVSFDILALRAQAQLHVGR